MTFPAMVLTVTERAADLVILDVEHDPRQSYSRSVDPRAMREARRILPRDGRQWALTSVNYDDPAPEGRALSRYHFVPT